jgi:glyoxylase I family protein
MDITGCLHTFVVVTDLDRAEHFYGTVLGLTKVVRDLKFPGAWYEVAGFQIHLGTVETLPDSPLAEKWGRNRHIAFAVTDLDAAKTELVAQGCPVQVSASGRAALFTQDPDGNVIELSQV